MSFLQTRPSPSLFPTYLVPSLPFRRRQSSNSTVSSTTSSSSPSLSSTTSPYDPFAQDPFSAISGTSPTLPSYLHGHQSHLRCSRCSTDLALTSQIISKGFTGRHGRAYLVSGSPVAGAIAPTPLSSSIAGLPNTTVHKAVPRQLVTGAHTVSDISCVFCGQVLGWQYVSAEEESQRYKVGKFILETKRVVASSNWEIDDDDAGELISGLRKGMPPERLDRAGKEDVEFDSQDEDECEDLFAGVWSPALAEKRRRRGRFGRRAEVGERSRSEEV